MTEMHEVATGLQFPEGPIALADGSVLVVEIKRGALSRVSEDGAITVVADVGGGPNGAAVGPDGKVYVCNNGGFTWRTADGRDTPAGTPADYTGGSIQRVDLDTGAVDELYTRCGDVPLRGPNDIVFDEAGGFYFTDMGKTIGRVVDRGAVYYATPDGTSIVEVAYPMDHPNGIGLSPDGTRLYVAESVTGRIWYWDVAGPGRLEPSPLPGSGRGRLLYSPGGYEPYDSLAVDSEGNVCVATLLTGAITVVSPAGELVDVVKVPGDDPMVTNICFGGPDLRTAFITSSGRGRLYATEWHCPGLAPLFPGSVSA